MSNEQIKRCHTCSYWTGNRRDPEGQGECKQGPPQVAGIVPQQNRLTGQVTPSIISGWPAVPGMQWCGAWTPAIVELDS